MLLKTPSSTKITSGVLLHCSGQSLRGITVLVKLYSTTTWRKGRKNVILIWIGYSVSDQPQLAICSSSRMKIVCILWPLKPSDGAITSSRTFTAFHLSSGAMDRPVPYVKVISYRSCSTWTTQNIWCAKPCLTNHPASTWSKHLCFMNTESRRIMMSSRTSSLVQETRRVQPFWASDHCKGARRLVSSVLEVAVPHFGLQFTQTASNGGQCCAAPANGFSAHPCGRGLATMKSIHASLLDEHYPTVPLPHSPCTPSTLVGWSVLHIACILRLLDIYFSPVVDDRTPEPLPFAVCKTSTMLEK